MRKLLCIILVFVGLTGFKQEDNRVITGIVTLKGDDQPLFGISVMIKGTNKGVITDINGRYHIAVPKHYRSLIFSASDYTSREMKIGKGDTININLEFKNQGCSERVGF
jgi:hypothetical protein